MEGLIDIFLANQSVSIKEYLGIMIPAAASLHKNTPLVIGRVNGQRRMRFYLPFNSTGK